MPDSHTLAILVQHTLQPVEFQNQQNRSLKRKIKKNITKSGKELGNSIDGSPTGSLLIVFFLFFSKSNSKMNQLPMLKFQFLWFCFPCLSRESWLLYTHRHIELFGKALIHYCFL